jgi:Domain of unknown function (DUF4328)
VNQRPLAGKDKGMSNMQTENPYSAPESALQGSELLDRVTAGKYFFRPANGLAMGTYIAVGAHIVALLMNMAVLIYERHILGLVQSGAAIGPDVRPALASGDKLLVVTNALILVCLLVSYVLGGMWIYRVACNVRALGAGDLDDSPGWAVGWYAVPFANLVRPFRAMRQIFLASEKPHDWDDNRKPPLVIVWWTLFLLYSIGGYAISKLTQGNNVDAVMTTQLWLIVYRVVCIIASAAFIKVVWEITRLQAKTHAAPTGVRVNLADNPAFANI